MKNRILVCDDSRLTRDMLRDILTQNGYKVVGEAENGVEAIEKFKELYPDLVLMDIVMEKMDGITALKEIMKLDAKARVVMCSGMGMQMMVIDAIQNGAKDFIVKPFSSEGILEIVGKAIEE